MTLNVAPRPFVGRSAEIARAVAMLDRAREGQGGLLRIIGEPGIGKTRLADELSAAAAARDMRVAWGRCWEAGGAPAFWPWTQIVRSLGLESGLSVLTGAAVPTGLAQGASLEDAEHARFQLYADVSAAIARAASTTPSLLVLDDLHAADVPSLLLLRFLARDIRACRLLVVATHREVEARVRPEVGEHLAKLSYEGETISLARLGENDVAEWLRSVGRSVTAARRLHEATEGNPLFVHEMLEISRDAEESIQVPDAVHSAITEHLARLSVGTRRILGAMAVVGREASRSEIARLAEVSLGEVAATVREASILGVVETRGAETVAFRHILLRDELYDRLETRARAALHGRLATMLTERAALGDDNAMLRAAHHELEAALTGGSTTRAIASARRAATRLIDRVAYEQAAELLGRAVMLLEASSSRDDALECELLVDWGQALILSGAGPRGRDVCARGAEIAKAVGAAELVVRASLVYGSEALFARRDERMVSLLRDALEAVGPDASAKRAHVMARLSAALVPTTGDLEEPGRLAREAIAMARSTGDEMALLQTLYFGSGALVFSPLDSRERLALTTEAVQLAERLGKPSMAAALYPWVIAGELEVGSALGSDRATERLARLIVGMPQPTYRVRLPIMQAGRASLEGRWSDAEQHIAEAAALAKGADAPLPEFLVTFARLGLHHARGDGAAMAADYEAASAVFKTFPSGRLYEALWAAIEANAGCRDLETARQTVRRELNAIRSILEAAGLLGLGPAVAASTLVGDRELTAQLEPLITPYEVNSAIVWLAGWIPLAPTALVFGDMHALLGRTEAARVRYDAAISFATTIGARAYVTRAMTRREQLGEPVHGSSRAPTPSSAARPSPLVAADKPTGPIELVAEGETWRLRAGSSVLHLRASKGLSYLATLLSHPNEEIHVTSLVGAGEEARGDAGPMLDEPAKAAYRRRATELREVIEEAEARGDVTASEAARDELDALASELARAVGLGGRDRRAASAVERMRINVQRCVRDAIARVSSLDPSLGKHLEASVRTGTFCSYLPSRRRQPG